MPTWERAFPKDKPFECRHYWHLRKSGNLLAIYDFLGALTNGGKNPFLSSVRKVSIYFYGEYSDASYETVGRAFRTLLKMGWLRHEGKDLYYVSHKEWAEAHPGQCHERGDVFPWQESPDPIVGKIWAIAGGRIHVHEGMVKAIRKWTTDSEFLTEYQIGMDNAKAKRAEGNYHHTNPKAVFWETYNFFKAIAAEPVRSK